MKVTRALDCPACGGLIEIKAAGHSVMIACRYCGSELDVSREDVRIIREFHEEQNWLELPLGRRGTLDGVQWEVIGAQQRSDDEAEWTEYLLFNPYAGYAWLVDGDEGWTFGTMITDRPEPITDTSVHWRGEGYRRAYEPVETTTDRVIGEFYWRARAGDTVRATSYTRGRTILSLEIGENEVTWTVLLPVTDGKINASFRKTAEPLPEGAGRAERMLHDFDRTPAMHKSDLWTLSHMGLWTFLIAFAVMLMAGWSPRKAEAGPLDVPTSASQPGGEAPPSTMTIPGIEVRRTYGFVTVETASSELNNQWVDIDFSLVNRATQQSFDAYDLVERYSGTDADGPWSEGNTVTTTRFGGIPAGTYDLIVEASAKHWTGSGSASSFGYPFAEESPPIGLWFRVESGGWHGSDAFLWFCLILGFPIIILWWRHS